MPTPTATDVMIAVAASSRIPTNPIKPNVSVVETTSGRMLKNLAVTDRNVKPAEQQHEGDARQDVVDLADGDVMDLGQPEHDIPAELPRDPRAHLVHGIRFSGSYTVAMLFLVRGGQA